MSTRKFLILPADELPNAALNLGQPAAEKRKRLRVAAGDVRSLRREGEGHPCHLGLVRPIRWARLCLPSDATLARETALALNKLEEETLTLIDRGGGIARVHRIKWRDAAAHLPIAHVDTPRVGGLATPQDPTRTRGVRRR